MKGLYNLRWKGMIMSLKTLSAEKHFKQKKIDRPVKQ